MRQPAFLLLICVFTINISAQPLIQWQKCLGGSFYEEANSTKQTSDGGYIVTGTTGSFDGDVTNNHGVIDGWVIKLSSNGSVQWEKTLGGSSGDVLRSVEQTIDGGYIVAGYSYSDDGDISENHGKSDFWVIKLSADGIIQWQKTLGGSEIDEADTIIQLSDGSYILVGYTESNDGDVSGNHGLGDFWLVKLSEQGDLTWQKTFGGTSNENATTVHQTSDGGFIIGGKTLSNDGDVSGNHGNWDYWVLKLNADGQIEWQKTFGGSGEDSLGTISQTQDGGYIVSGTVGSDDGQVLGVYGKGDGWVIKLDTVGNLEWQKVLGGSEQDGAGSVLITSDGGYVISCLTESTDGEVLNNDGGADIWIVKLTSAGTIKWQATYGGTMAEAVGEISYAADGGFIMAGLTWSNDGDVSGNHGYGDIWVVKLSPDLLPVKDLPSQSSPLEIYPNPTNDKITLNAAGETTLEIQISDMLGRNILEQSIANGDNLKVTSLSDGLYIVTARTSDGKIYTSRFLKQKGD